MGEHKALYNDLAALAGSGVSCLEPVLRSFRAPEFESRVHNFVAMRAHEFTLVNVDGSHPLQWTESHAEYKVMFERQLSSVFEDDETKLGRMGISERAFFDFCAWLRANADLLGDDEGVYHFLDEVTASENYEVFLAVMFAEVVRQGSVPAAQEIEVLIPEWFAAGDILPVEYLGVRYDLTIPESCGLGMVFRAAITS